MDVPDRKAFYVHVGQALPLANFEPEPTFSQALSLREWMPFHVVTKTYTIG
jgi:hypothetical protein